MKDLENEYWKQIEQLEWSQDGDYKRIEQQLFGFKALDFDYYAKNVFRRSIFSTKEKFFTFLENPSKMKLERDPAYTTMMSIYDYYLENHYQNFGKNVRF